MSRSHMSITRSLKPRGAIIISTTRSGRNKQRRSWIGVWNGKRAVRMIETARAIGIEKPAYYGFDLFEDLGETGYQDELSKMPPSEKEVTALLEETGAEVHLYRGNTHETLPNAVERVPKMDFVFLDGGHSVETIENDWRYVQEVMDENTVVIFDDYWRNRTDAGCKPIVDAIDRSKYDVEILPEVDSFTNTDFGRLDISFAKVVKK